MGFLSNLFGTKRKAEQKGISDLDDFDQKPDIDVFNKLVDTIVFSELVKEGLKKDLTEAFDNPKTFYDEQGEFILSERGLTYAKNIDLTPKFVFIDTLINEEQMAEVDWKEEETEIRTWIRRIMETKQFPFIISAIDRHENKNTYDVIQLINNHELIPNGYTLQILDINSDCYVFTIVPIEQSKTVKELFAQLK